MASTDFSVTILGSGAALPSHLRHCSGQVVAIRGFRILLDCSEGTQTRLRFCRQRLQSISMICITHLHGDHFFGLPGLLSTMQLCGRKEGVTVVGPRGLREILETMFSLSGNRIEFPIDYRELSEEEVGDGSVRVFEERRLEVEAFGLRHSVPTFGYRITEHPVGQRGARSYAYCSDTCCFDELVSRTRGVDLLCMESTYGSDFVALAERYLHSTAAQAADIARRAGVKRLLLTHFSHRYKDLGPLLDEARAVFANSDLANDGDVYYVE